jgi:excisionase family DNA binding protein
VGTKISPGRSSALRRSHECSPVRFDDVARIEGGTRREKLAVGPSGASRVGRPVGTMRSVRRDYLLKVEVGDAEMNICEKKEDCPVVTVREAARYLGSSRNHVFTLIHSGALPYQRMGRRHPAPWRSSVCYSRFDEAISLSIVSRNKKSFLRLLNRKHISSARLRLGNHSDAFEEFRQRNAKG